MTAPRNRVLVGDVRELLRTLDTGSVDMVLTSPPYFRLRDYASEGQIGLEAVVDDWVDQLAQVATEVRRVLAPTGTLWLNLGDSYATHRREGAPRKSLLLGPERLALRLVADGWALRNKIVWQKPNPMPTSVTDRLTCTWEALYIFAQQPHYFFDIDAIRVHIPATSPGRFELTRRRGNPGAARTAVRPPASPSSKRGASPVTHSVRMSATSGESPVAASAAATTPLSQSPWQPGPSRPGLPKLAAVTATRRGVGRSCARSVARQRAPR